MENKNEIFDVLWTVPDTEIGEIYTMCDGIEDLMIFIRASVDHKIKIISINGMEVFPASNVKVEDEKR